MHRLLILFPLLTVFFMAECAAQDSSWKLEKDEDGIKVYVRPNEGSDFDEFKATTTIPDCSVDEALAVLLDIANYEDWFPDCDNPKILEQKSKYHDIHYIETVAPWPVDTRCGVYEQTATLSNGGTKAEVVFIAQADYPIDIDDMVRITEGKGIWTLEKVGSSLSVTYQFKGNPGGDIPAWLANAFVVKHPYETLTSFKEVMGE